MQLPVDSRYGNTKIIRTGKRAREYQKYLPVLELRSLDKFVCTHVNHLKLSTHWSILHDIRILRCPAATPRAAPAPGCPHGPVKSWGANGGLNAYRTWAARLHRHHGVHLADQDEQQRGVGLQQLLSSTWVPGCTSLSCLVKFEFRGNLFYINAGHFRPSYLYYKFST